MNQDTFRKLNQNGVQVYVFFMLLFILCQVPIFSCKHKHECVILYLTFKYIRYVQYLIYQKDIVSLRTIEARTSRLSFNRRLFNETINMCRRIPLTANIFAPKISQPHNLRLKILALSPGSLRTVFVLSKWAYLVIPKQNGMNSIKTHLNFKPQRLISGLMPLRSVLLC